MARKLATSIDDDYENKAFKAMACLDKGLEDATTILQLPVRYHQRLRTSILFRYLLTPLLPAACPRDPASFIGLKSPYLQMTLPIKPFSGCRGQAAARRGIVP